MACWTGTYLNDASCPCTGTLATCSAGQTLTTARTTLSYVQGVCDDLGPVACAGMFTLYHEGCGIPLPSNGNLSGSRTSVTFRICYDPTAVGDCSGAVPAGTVILSGVGSYENHGETAGASFLSLGDITSAVSTKFVFNGGNRKVKMKRGIATQVTQSGVCDTIPCAAGGCVTKVK